MFAPIPPWEGTHPIVVHFPIALLAVAPLFIVLSMVWRRHATPMALSALILMLLGTGGAMLAVSSGEAAYHYAEDVLGVDEATDEHMEEHEEAGELSRNLFVGLTLAYIGLLVLPRLWQAANETKIRLVLYAGFLLLYLAGLGQLANTGHLGGTLVHDHGVHAPLGGLDTGATGAATHEHDGDEAHNHDE